MNDLDRANDIAAQIATTEMLRLILANFLVGTDSEATKRNLVQFEKLAVENIQGRRLFPEANEATETYIKEAAANYISRVIGSIDVNKQTN
ncbi:hypothetical protein FY134_18305 [Agrobacterium fabrum]|jgi:hypothetical protein|uniref:hypothetical protein n=1 Tax=Agrobacterium fabrum TaxID=1176649 RepID=UPI0021CE2D69|nr:hypothetical protein [Agrobacterium fabrum]UXT59651.1 hypothetical protein FY134_18305 [Agrobacterium fabrum]